MINTTTRRTPGRVSGILGVLCGLALAGCAAQAVPSFDPAEEVALPAGHLKFEKINPAVSMAGAWGDRSQGAHGTFGKFPANFKTPEHLHSGAYHGVVLKGVMTNPFAGEKNPPEMVAGSYWYVPAGAAHATACVSQSPCEFYFHAESPFDFQVIEAQ